VFDPWVSVEEAFNEYGISPINKPSPASYDAIIVAVAHSQFREMGVDKIRSFG
jgi:UDP-N-acetyl-D-galactosamine dehydrogenase